MIPLFKVYMASGASAAAARVLDSGFIGQGPVVEEFEQKLRVRFDHPHLVTLNSGTSGLHLALHLLKRPTAPVWPGLDADSEVLTTALTCTATNWPILANGLKPRWVDIDPETLNMDLDDLERKLTPSTRVIMLIHWGGYPIDLGRVKAIQEKAFGLWGFRPAVIEDCAHAFGSTYQGKPLGTHGNLTMYSFQAIKHFTTVDGGMLMLPHRELLRRAKLARWYGIDRDGNRKDFRCLHPRTLVRLADGRRKQAQQVYRDRDTGVLSIDADGNIAPTRIVAWYKNRREGRAMLSLTTKGQAGREHTLVTADHKILTPDGWIEAGALRDGDRVVTSLPAPNSRQLSLIVGSLLGDACFTTKGGRRAVFYEGHSAMQAEYLQLKAAALRSLGSKVFERDPDPKHPNGTIHCYTPSLPALGELRAKFYPAGKKVVPRELVEEVMGPSMLAAWFLDDGSIQVASQRDGIIPHAQIATNGFTKEDIDWLSAFLTGKGYPCSARSGRLFFTRQGSERLLADVAPFTPACMRYKVAHSAVAFDSSLWETGATQPYVDEVIVKAAPWAGRDVYCFEVEAPSHSLLTSSVAVHNCEADIDEWGFKFHMNDVCAAIGIENLKEVDGVIGRHQGNAAYYDTALRGISGVTLLTRHPDRTSAFWIYSLLVERREEFMAAMKDRGVTVSQVHERNDKHGCMREYRTFLPNLDRTIGRVVSIPVGWWVTPEQREQIVDAIRKGW